MKRSEAMLAITLSYADAHMIDVVTGKSPIKRLTEKDIEHLKLAEEKRQRKNLKRIKGAK